MAKNAASRETGIFDANKVPKYITRIEDVQSEIDKIMADAAKDCAPLYEDIAKIKKEAADNDNVPRKALNAFIQKRKLERKADAVPTKLSDDQKHHLEQMEFAFAKASRKDAPAPKAAANDQPTLQ